MKQPKWRLVAQLGDVNPVEYGGYFVYIDGNNIYPPEAELLEVYEDDADIPMMWTHYRFVLDRCTFQDGILSDNSSHPELKAWFADGIARLATFSGQTEIQLIDDFCSADPIARAQAYRVVGDYFGFLNLDAYPSTYKVRSKLPLRFRRKTR